MKELDCSCELIKYLGYIQLSESVLELVNLILIF